MRIHNGVVYIDNEVAGVSPGTGDYTGYTDNTGTHYNVSNKLIVRLYELMKFDHERRGIDFEKWCNDLFEKERECLKKK